MASQEVYLKQPTIQQETIENPNSKRGKKTKQMYENQRTKKPKENDTSPCFSLLLSKYNVEKDVNYAVHVFEALEDNKTLK